MKLLIAFNFFLGISIASNQKTFQTKIASEKDFNFFMSFAGQDRQYEKLENGGLRFFPNSASLVSIPKGTLLYHLTGVDPSFYSLGISNDWERLPATWFCFFPEYCLSFGGSTLMVYETTETIKLVYFAGKGAWKSSYSTIEAFIDGKFSGSSFENAKKFCNDKLKPNGWVTSNYNFEVVICSNYTKTSFLKFVDNIKKTGTSGQLMGQLMGGVNDLNRYVDLHIGTVSVLNPYFKLSDGIFNPGRNALKEDVKVFSERLQYFFKSQECWDEAYLFASYEKKVKRALTDYLDVLYAILDKFNSKISWSAKQRFIFSLLVPFKVEHLDTIFTPYPNASSECGRKMILTYKDAYECSQRVWKDVSWRLGLMANNNIKENEFNRLAKELNGIFRYSF